jgi:hypothetical protein
VHVFSFPEPAQRLMTLETRDNPLGLCELAPLMTAERHLLVFPGHKLGSIQLVVRKLNTTLFFFCQIKLDHVSVACSNSMLTSADILGRAIISEN